MAFKIDIQDWKSYSDNEYYMRTVPDSFWSELEGIALRAASSDSNLISIINHMAEVIPSSPTTNWGGNFLRSDLSDKIREIRKKVSDGKLPPLFDCLAVLIEIGDLTCDDINELLEDSTIGYECERDSITGKIHWETKLSSDIVSEMTETQNIVQPVSKQAYESFERAKVSLESATDERARKDAVRSCLDAVEAIVKEYGNDIDIKQASKNLRAAGIWGLDDIVKDGDAMFSNMHRLYPDLRHGSTKTSTMSLEEAEYWIGRFSVYLRYMKKMADKNGVK